MEKAQEIDAEMAKAEEVEVEAEAEAEAETVVEVEAETVVESEVESEQIMVESWSAILRSMDRALYILLVVISWFTVVFSHTL